MMLAAKHLDPLLGIDVHIVQPPGPVPPIPVPHPYVGIVMDPFDYAPFIGATVSVNHLPRAQAGTSGQAIPPHIPIGGVFVKPPSNESEMFMGSATVSIDGDAMTYLALPVLSCQDVGMIAPPRPKKKATTKSMVLPTTVVLPIPAGPPVLVGGPPTISLMALGMRMGMAALGRAFKKLRSLQKASKRMKAASDRVHRAARRAMDALGVPPSVQNRVHRGICSVTGHPVDVATGKVFTEALDFELPGSIPLQWERVYYSCSTYRGPLGRGWHHAYDLALIELESVVVVRLPDGRPLAFAKPERGTSAFAERERMSLFRDADGFRLRLSNDLCFRFGKVGTPAGFAGTSAAAGVGHSGPTDAVVRRPLALENRLGEQISFAYDAAGHLRRMTDSVGRNIDVQWNAEGYIAALTTAHPDRPEQAVQVVGYRYDRDGHLLEVSDAHGQSTRYAYADGLLVRETNRNGLSFFFEYDSAQSTARCIHTWGDGGIYRRKLSFLPDGITEVEDSLGATTRYLTRDGVVVSRVDGRGGEWMFERDACGRIVTECTPLGAKTSHAHDARGNLVATNHADGTSTASEFDEHDRRVRFVDKNGSVWCWQYDARGRLVERVDAMGKYTRYQHQGSLVTRVEQADGTATQLEYDSAANLVRATDAMGRETQWQYDGWGRPIAQADAKGNVTRRRYDLLGRIVAVAEADGATRSLEYDPEGFLCRIDSGSRRVEFAYRGMGRLCRRSEGGTFVEFAYDSEEQLVGIRNELGHAFTLVRDAEGDIVAEHGFDGGTRGYVRDPAGRVREVRSPAGNVTKYLRDPLGRILAVEYADATQHAYAYRADGALLEARNGSTTVRFERDALGRVMKEWQGEHWVAVERDVMGARTTIRSSLGMMQSLTRRRDGEVERISVSESPDAERELESAGRQATDVVWTCDIHRDALGHEVERQLPGGLVSRWTRARTGHALRHDVFAEQRLYRQREYQWEHGQLRRVVDADGTSIEFQHDPTGQLAWAKYADGTGELRMPDAVGNLFCTRDRRDRVYSESGQLREADTARGRVRYEYDLDGHLVRKIEPDGGVWQYAWNGAGYLSEVVRPDGRRVTFEYDALGRRIRKTFAGVMTCWVWDGNNPLHEWKVDVEPPSVARAGGAPVEPSRPPVVQMHSARGPPHVITWIFDPGGLALVAKIENGQALSIVSDHLGTPIGMFDAKGARVWAAELDTHGKVRTLKGERHACPFRFPGQYEDDETGLHYNRFRYYDPEAGTYISADPIGLRGGLRAYAYVIDPTRATDAFGLARECGDLDDLPESVMFRVRRGDKKGRPFGSPRNPRAPTVEEFNPRIEEVRAGDLADSIVERKHGLYDEQSASVRELSNDELVEFRPDDPMSATRTEEGLSLTGGHHRTAEISRRVDAGEMDPDTLVPMLVHD